MHERWQILLVNESSCEAHSLSALLHMFQFKGQGTDVSEISIEQLSDNTSYISNFHLAIFVISKQHVTVAEHILTQFSQFRAANHTSILLAYSDEIDQLLSQEKIDNLHIHGFLSLDELSDINTFQLIKSSLRNTKARQQEQKHLSQLRDSKQQLNKSARLMEETEVLSLSGGWEWDIQAEKLFWTNGVYHIHDLPEGTPLDTIEAINFYLPEYRSIIANAVEQAIKQEEVYDLTLKIQSAKGKLKTVRTTGKVRKSQGQVTHIYGSITDISSFADICQNLQAKKDFIAGILDGISDAVLVLDQTGNILDINPATEQIFMYSREDLIGNNVSMLIPFSKRASHHEYMQAYSQGKLTDIIGKHRNIRAQKADSSTFPVEITINRISQREQPVYISLVRDISLRVEKEERIQELAFKDRVTKLSNYQSFEVDYDRELEKFKLTKDNACFVQISIEHFFKINFAYGHSFGNEVLRYIALLLTNVANHFNGKIYRISGISFVMMFAHKQDAITINKAVKKDLLDNLLHKHEIDGKSFDLTPVVTTYSDNAQRIEKTGREILTLLELCKQGRDRKTNLTLIDEKYLARVNRDLKIERKLKQAIESNHGFYLLYQPQMGANGKPYAAEALIRWQDDKLGVVYPDEFIKIAERTGLIIPLTKWVLNQCLSDIKELIERDIHLPISINISANHIIQSDFVDDIQQALQEHKVPSNYLVLELTESAFADDMFAAAMNMNELNKAGISFSLDDFGTGYSNLGYLNQLPFDEMKIDKLFVDNILHDENEKNLLETIVMVGKSKGLKIIAEGVETQAQFELLKNYNIDLFQGYYYSKPIALDKLTSLLT